MSLKNLNPGIRATVEWLRENNFETVDSGDGETHEFECDQDQPYVHITTHPGELISETNRLLMLLADRGVTLQPMDEENTVPTIQAFYQPVEELATITLWNVKL